MQIRLIGQGRRCRRWPRRRQRASPPNRPAPARIVAAAPAPQPVHRGRVLRRNPFRSANSRSCPVPACDTIPVSGHHGPRTTPTTLHPEGAFLQPTLRSQQPQDRLQERRFRLLPPPGHAGDHERLGSRPTVRCCRLLGDLVPGLTAGRSVGSVTTTPFAAPGSAVGEGYVARLVGLAAQRRQERGQL